MRSVQFAAADTVPPPCPNGRRGSGALEAVTDYATVAVEMLADNADPAAGDLYAAIDMDFAVLNSQIRESYAATADAPKHR